MKKRKTANRLTQTSRRGGAAIELALTAPFLLMLILGMVELARALMVQQVLTNASRVGARAAVLDTATVNSVELAVEDYLRDYAINSANIEVSPNPPTSAIPGDPVSVTIAVEYTDVAWLPLPEYMGDATQTATAVMRRESTQ